MEDALERHDPAPSKYFGNHGRGETPQPLLLEPTHAMMERFQSALNKHLLRQKQKFLDEIAQLKQELKAVDKEEDDFGKKLAMMKHDVNLQEKQIHDQQITLAELREQKLSLNATLLETKARVNETRKLYDEELMNVQDLQIEMEKLSTLERKVTEWKDEMEGDLAVNLRVTEKTEADRKKLLEDNRKLDMYIFRLTTEVHKLESELSLLHDQLDRREKDKNLLQEAIADANADLLEATVDQKRLLAEWNSRVVAMGQRDAAYNEAVKHLSEAQEEFRNLNTEIEGFKKSGEEEIRRSEELGLQMNRARNEKEKYSRKLKSLMEMKMKLAVQIGQTADLNTQADRDLAIAESQSRAREQELEHVKKELQELIRQKENMEDECLNLLLEQSVNDKAATNLNHMVQQLREKSKVQEMGLIELDHKIAKLISQTDDVRTETARNQEILDEMNRDLNAKEMELSGIEGETADFQNKITNRQGKLLTLSRKIEELARNAGWDALGKTPAELRARGLEWAIEDMHKQNQQMQSRWMRQQQSNVKLTQQKAEQSKEISLLRKQLILLEQKNMKTNQELEKEEQLEGEIARSIEQLQHRLTTLSASLASKSGLRKHVDKDLLLQQTVFVKSLKDAELEQMKVKQEIEELELLLEERADAMLETQREMLSWEKKVKMTLETKQAILKEKSDAGDIGQMRQEIHRMEVRLGQLKKVQNKLTNDLEQTIRRREAIVDEADAREKRERGTSRSRANFQRKLDEIRNRLKILRQEQKMMDKLVSDSGAHNNELQGQVKIKSERVKNLQSELRRLDRQIEDAQLTYQLNVEILVRRQRKCKLLGQVKAGKYRSLYKNELTVEHELGVARSINADLTAILESLIADFPPQRALFQRILNTLRPDEA